MSQGRKSYGAVREYRDNPDDDSYYHRDRTRTQEISKHIISFQSALLQVHLLQISSDCFVGWGTFLPEPG